MIWEGKQPVLIGPVPVIPLAVWARIAAQIIFNAIIVVRFLMRIYPNAPMI